MPKGEGEIKSGVCCWVVPPEASQGTSSHRGSPYGTEMWLLIIGKDKRHGSSWSGPRATSICKILFLTEYGISRQMTECISGEDYKAAS